MEAIFKSAQDSGERVKQFFCLQGIEIDFVEFEQTTHNCVTAAKALGVDIAQIVKSILFAGKDMNVLVLTTGDRKIDIQKLKKIVGCNSLKMAPPDLVYEKTGFPVGGVCPVAHPEPIPIIIDTYILNFPYVYVGGGTLNSMVGIATEQLLAVTKGKLANISKQIS